MKWWTKAADSGSVAALANIATAYYAGLGVQQDYPEAAKWFQLAADKGDADAMNMLGMTAARLGPNQLAGAEGLARKIAVTIVSRRARTPDRKSDQALLGSKI